jgi:hypothetical protein
VRLSDIGSAVLGPENIETKLSQSGLPLVGLAMFPRPEQLFRYFKIMSNLKKKTFKRIN